MRYLISNSNLITWGDESRVLLDHAMLVEDGLIAEIGPDSAMQEKYPQLERIDANGQYVMPGGICAHTHFYGAYARGMAIPGPAPEDFPAILKRLWWPLDEALDRDAVRLSALVCLLDAIKHGTTTLIDHHASPNCIDGSLDLIADAVEQAGLRAVLCYEVTDRGGMDKAQAGIAENVRFLSETQNRPRVRGAFGLHASLTLSDETLRACADAVSSDVGFHVHVAEHEADQTDSLRRSGQRVVHRLDHFGLWRSKSIAAHCVHVDADERAILRERGVWVTHQPRSNMNNGVGAADIDGMLAEGMRLCLGNDGFTNDMWAEWKEAYLLQKVIHRDPRRANGADIARMATAHNAALAAAFFPGASIGVLEPGARADFILVDYKPFTPLSEGNLPWHILFGFQASMVTATFVDGVALMLDRQLKTLDEQAIVREALEHAPHVWSRYTRYASNALQS